MQSTNLPRAWAPSIAVRNSLDIGHWFTHTRIYRSKLAIDANRMRDVVLDLVNRHPVLATKYRRVNDGDYIAVSEGAECVDVRTIDVQHTGSAEKDFSFALNKAMAVRCNPFHGPAFKLWQFAESGVEPGTTIGIQALSSNVDAQSMEEISEFIAREYLSNCESSNFTHPQNAHFEYISWLRRSLLSSDHSDQREQAIRYWRDYLPQDPSSYSIPSIGREVNGQIDGRSVVGGSRLSLFRLVENPAIGGTVDALLATLLATVIAEWRGRSDSVLWMWHDGRAGINRSQAIGPLASAYPLYVRIQPDELIGARIQRASYDISARSAHLALDAGQIASLVNWGDAGRPLSILLIVLGIESKSLQTQAFGKRMQNFGNYQLEPASPVAISVVVSVGSDRVGWLIKFNNHSVSRDVAEKISKEISSRLTQVASMAHA